MSDNLLPLGNGYTLIRRIGGGGFGEVWRAEAPGGFPVAIKILFRNIEHAEGQRELQALELIRCLQHPFLIATTAYWCLNDKLYILMELAEGSLRDRLAECRQAGLLGIPPPELIKYMFESAEALDYLHSQKVLHRDIKPENILLMQRHAKLADFGLVRLQESSQRLASVTGSGTPLYMPPEIWHNKASIHSDQYSLAMTFAELRLGARPFEGRDMMSAMMAALYETPNLAPLPAPEQEVLLRAMHKNADKRYPSCLEFVQALSAVVTAENTPPTHEATAPRGRVVPHDRVPTPARGDTPGTGGRKPLPNERTVSPFGSVGEISEAGPRGGASQPSLGKSAVALDPQQTLKDDRVLTPPPEAAPPGWHDQAQPPPRMASPWRRLLWLAGLLLLASGAVVLALCAWPRHSEEPVVPPPAPAEVDWLPPGFHKGEKAEIKTLRGKRLYSQVVKVQNGQSIAFRLVWEDQGGPTPFYIMENKVWNGLYRAATSDQAFSRRLDEIAAKFPWAVKKEEWLKGGLAAGKDMGSKDDLLPVFRVTVAQAACLAEWLKGHLPSARQWDLAGGRSRGALAPFRDPEKSWKPGELGLGLGLVGPLPVGTAKRDVSLFVCRDMAGNGKEFTSSLFGDSSQNLRLDRLRPDHGAELRGQSYFASEPFRFPQMPLDPIAGKLPYGETRPDVGFRVVIELSSGR